MNGLLGIAKRSLDPALRNQGVGEHLILIASLFTKLLHFLVQLQRLVEVSLAFEQVRLVADGIGDLGNEIVARNDPSELTGVFSYAFVGRNVTGSIDPSREPIATFDSFNKIITEAEGVLSYTLNGGVGNIYAFTAPKVQITGAAEADREAIRTEALDLAFNKSVAAGDDEIQLVFT